MLNALEHKIPPPLVAIFSMLLSWHLAAQPSMGQLKDALSGGGDAFWSLVFMIAGGSFMLAGVIGFR